MDIKQKLHDGSYRVTQLVRHDGEHYALPKPIEYSARCTRLADERAKDWQDGADKWCITINSEVFEYYTGVGHRTKDKPVKPDLSSVLWNLVMDSRASECSFEEWCWEYGYDEDSIKAFEIYRACQKSTNQLAKAGIYINEDMKEFFQEF